MKYSGNYSFWIDGIYYIINPGERTVSVVACDNEKSSYNIPSSVKDYIEYKVTSINSRAFYGCEGLTSITIPDSVTSIGAYAFYNCTGLTSITIPDGVTKIEHETFWGCKKLTSITIPDGVTSIGSSAFSVCNNLTSIIIPGSVKNIGFNAFTNCKEITFISVSSDNTVYDSRENCNAIIETRTNELIQGCQNTIIPASVTSISNHAFCGCNYLKIIDIPDSVKHISSFTFDSCGLTSIDIPNSIKGIGTYAFSSNYNLETIVIPDSVEYINERAFCACESLEEVYLPDSNEYELRGEVFYGCKSLKAIHSPAKEIQDIVFADDALEGLNLDECVLYVPAGTRWAYRHHPGFGKFKNIEIEPRKS